MDVVTPPDYVIFKSNLQLWKSVYWRWALITGRRGSMRPTQQGGAARTGWSRDPTIVPGDTWKPGKTTLIDVTFVDLSLSLVGHKSLPGRNSDCYRLSDWHHQVSTGLPYSSRPRDEETLSEDDMTRTSRHPGDEGRTTRRQVGSPSPD
jgi:hypothetical protein